jgi:DNA-binding response OmpR family regulator
MTFGRVLIVDDNDALSATLRENLEDDGYEALRAATAAEALRLLKKGAPDLILLDLLLPDGDGLSLISSIRKCTDAPIIVISGKGAWVDKVVGLEVGADDYLAKPFEMKELLARVKAGLRRYKGNQAAASDLPLRIRFGAHVLDAAKFQAFDQAGKSCELTAMEFRLLDALVRAAGRVLSREQLLDRAREGNPDVFDRAVDIQITRLRRKMGDDPKAPKIIQTVRGIGYALACETEVL